MRPIYLEKLKTALDKNPQAGFSYCDRKIGLERNEDIIWLEKRSVSFSKEELMKRNYISYCSMVREEAIQGFDMELNRKRLQDWDFWLSIVVKGWEAVYVPEFLFLMYIRPDGISANMESWNEAVKYIQRKYGLKS